MTLGGCKSVPSRRNDKKQLYYLYVVEEDMFVHRESVKNRGNFGLNAGMRVPKCRARRMSSLVEM